MNDYQKHAEALQRETQLLIEAGYFDPKGNPRTDAKGKEIWAKVQRQLRKVQPFPRQRA